MKTVYSDPPATIVVEEHNGKICLCKIGHGTPEILGRFLSKAKALEYQRLSAMHDAYVREVGRQGL